MPISRYSFIPLVQTNHSTRNTEVVINKGKVQRWPNFEGF